VPIYEYVCEACGTLTELMQKVGEPPPRKCPDCGSRRIARLVSRTSFQLRGGGWYADLYSSPQKDAKKAAPPSGEGAPAAAAPAGDPAAKPAAEPAPAPATRPAAKGGGRPPKKKTG
jgi:putative FmdB family regulatory protein